VKVGTDKGYDVEHAGGSDVGSNGYFKFGTDQVPLWVSEFTTPFGLAGDTAQSVGTLTFFPRALDQTEFTFVCQAPNQKFYGQTVEIIRRAQKGFANLAEVWLNGYKLPVLRGGHDAFNALGYVRTVQRRHERWVYAPEFTFTFIAADILKPTGWSTAADLVKIRKLKSWQQIVEGIMAHDKNAGFASDPDQVPPAANPPASNAPGSGPIPPSDRTHGGHF